ncbi:MAG: hypothetical protein AAF989_04840, partial [Planctomycetota bacterium]
TLTQTGSRQFGQFTGTIASAWIHGLHGSALVALATAYGLARIPSRIQQAAVLDGSAWPRFWFIALPMVAPWVGLACLGVCGFAITEMTVVDLYGLRTIADEFYLFHASDPAPTDIALVCLLPAFIGMFGWTSYRIIGQRRRIGWSADSSIVNDPTLHLGANDSRWLTAFAVGCLVTFVALTLVVPLASFVIKVGHVVEVVDSTRTVQWSLVQGIRRVTDAITLYSGEYGWTLWIGCCTGAVSLLLAWPMASLVTSALTQRPSWRGIHPLDFVMLASALLPGAVTGLLVVWVFQLSFPFSNFLYQQTVVPTCVALAFRGIPVAYFVLRIGHQSLDVDLQRQAILDASWWSRSWFIHRSLMSRIIWISFVAPAIVASGDVPAMLPVLPPGVTTVGTRLFSLLHSGARFQEASLSFWYVATVTIIATRLATRYKSRW